MKNNRISHVVVTAILTFMVGNTSLVVADDTEIYLATSSSLSAANILLSFDTSTSMHTNLVDENNNGVIDAGERTRLVVLKEAMAEVLDILPSVNVGIMRNHDYGGPILYSVAPLDEYACIVEETCTTATLGSTEPTVRETLKEIVEDLVWGGWTPIAGAMLEASFYFRGEEVLYGRQRGAQQTYRVTRVSHATSYDAGGSVVTYPGACAADNLGHSDCATQVISGGTPLYKSPIVAECQTNHLVQITDGIGTFRSAGMTNTQGQNMDEQVLINALQAHDEAGNLITMPSCATDTVLPDGTTFSDTSHNECTVKLAQFLNNNDQSYTSTQNLLSGNAPIDGVQTIQIHNIGFALCGTGNVVSLSDDDEQVCCTVANHDTATGVCGAPNEDPIAVQVLKAQSAVGGGTYFNANTVEELVSALTSITDSILEKDTSFVSPSIAANAFNRLFSRDEIYFGLFKPQATAHWDGNLKKYNICLDTDPDDDGTDDCILGEVLDMNGDSAIIDDATSDDDGLFSGSSQSYWSAAADGGQTIEGGAGAEITDYTRRLIYTEYNAASGTAATGISLSDAGFFINSTNWDATTLSAVRDEVCPDATDISTGSDCENRMLWMLGADILNEDDDATTDTRWWFHDVLHSSPVVITYGQDASENFIDKILVGSNDGALHFINGSTGVEEWAFMPHAVLADQQTLYNNTSATHVYGLDSTASVDVSDVNLDGTIDPSEDYVRMVITQRRGGDNIYALDLTPSSTLTSLSDTVTPTFLWHISSSTTDFSRLGDTWSEPVLVTIIDANGDEVSALVFGGGYDTDLDSDDGSGISKNFGIEGGDPNIGNAIYVVDAETGELIFSISGTGSGANIEVAEMKYAIPSNVTVFDSDGDGYEDRIYVGDTAGQVWRVDLIDVDPRSSSAPQGSSVVGILANISTAGTLTKERRFFYKPTVVQVIDTVYSKAAGGKYDYVLIGTGNRANPLDTEVEDHYYAFRDVHTGPMTGDSSNFAIDYPINIDATAKGAAITDSDLIDVSSVVLTAASAQSALGWSFDFSTATPGREGEKVLAGSGVFDNTLVFTTYVPDDGTRASDPCAPAEGSGVAYNFNILSTAAVLDWDEDGTVESIDDRASDLSDGIPSDVSASFGEEGVTLLVGTGGGAKNLGQVAELPVVKTYWYEDIY